jgi:hypothetical protein
MEKVDPKYLLKEIGFLPWLNPRLMEPTAWSVWVTFFKKKGSGPAEDGERRTSVVCHSYRYNPELQKQQWICGRSLFFEKLIE